MKRVAELMRREPLVVRSSVTALIGLATAWGLIAWTDVQAEAVVTSAAVLLPAIVAAVTRSKVTPTETE